ncbi:SRPBCC family protein [Mycolicibacterium frederiksbergense]|uniref:SRPBCC family protein n=1 Tax=Mycolicibacterium frederiksbergense TaxID=117567 RepID=UPI00265B7969|nr:SRPBCC family protein [Mycolicibacterium frederiksbergense]MBX9919961.1 SRPBCC family protein [Mycolicibacterium frederiksbergense]MDO0977999.1 SRPBCC family protein [Mycolicibacterium frederiksbergense]
MQLVNEFVVDAPIDIAWAVLTDIPQVAACIPGAELESSDGDEHRANVTVKVGPVGLTLGGTARIVDRDDHAHQMVVRGTARDGKGNGSAEATVTMVAHDRGGRSAVTVTTDLELSGRVAQFGSGVIAQVSNRILKQFADRLNEAIAGPDERPDSSAHSASRAPVQAHLARTDERLVLAVTALAGVALGLAIGRTVRDLR